MFYLSRYGLKLLNYDENFQKKWGFWNANSFELAEFLQINEFLKVGFWAENETEFFVFSIFNDLSLIQSFRRSAFKHRKNSCPKTALAVMPHWAKFNALWIITSKKMRFSDAPNQFNPT